MSTTQDHGDIVFQCDAEACREMLETGTSNFDAARNFLRRAGWKPKRRGNGYGEDEWAHLCAGCLKAGVRL